MTFLALCFLFLCVELARLLLHRLGQDGVVVMDTTRKCWFVSIPHLVIAAIVERHELVY